VTIDLLQHADYPQDPTVFDATPIDANELDIYRELVNRVELHPPWDGEEKKLFLMLCLRYIPAKHAVVALSAKLEKKIVMASPAASCCFPINLKPDNP